MRHKRCLYFAERGGAVWCVFCVATPSRNVSSRRRPVSSSEFIRIGHNMMAATTNFTITDAVLGSGPDALKMKVLSNIVTVC